MLGWRCYELEKCSLRWCEQLPRRKFCQRSYGLWIMCATRCILFIWTGCRLNEGPLWCAFSIASLVWVCLDTGAWMQSLICTTGLCDWFFICMYEQWVIGSPNWPNFMCVWHLKIFLSVGNRWLSSSFECLKWNPCRWYEHAWITWNVLEYAG